MKGRRIHSTESILNAVIDYLDSKKSLSEIGSKYNMTGGNVRSWVIKLGYKPRKNKEAIFDPNRIKECCSLYLQGKSNKELSILFNVSRRTIFGWLIKNNIKPKKYNETKGVTNDKKNEAIRLYVEEQLNCCEISKILGNSNRSVLEWVKNIKKTKSELRIDYIIKNGGNNICHGKRGKLSTKYGIINFDSSYEKDRLIQLSSNPSVSNIYRCRDRIQYIANCGNKKMYNPDLVVEYSCGRVEIEEIKPFALINKFENRNKFKSAIKYYSEKNIKYNVVTEVKIYNKRAVSLWVKK
jgi:transposase-like protein